MWYYYEIIKNTVMLPYGRLEPVKKSDASATLFPSTLSFALLSFQFSTTAARCCSCSAFRPNPRDLELHVGHPAAVGTEAGGEPFAAAGPEARREPSVTGLEACGEPSDLP